MIDDASLMAADQRFERLAVPRHAPLHEFLVRDPLTGGRGVQIHVDAVFHCVGFWKVPTVSTWSHDVVAPPSLVPQ